MRNIKLFCRMGKFIRGYKVQLLLVGLCVILGAVMESLFADGSADPFLNPGGIFMTLGGIFLPQMWVEIHCAGIVKASPKRRMIGAETPVIISSIGFFLLFTLLLCIQFLSGSLGAGAQAGNLLCVALWVFLLMCYGSAGFKGIVVSSLFFILFSILLQTCGPGVLQWWEGIHGPIFSGSTALTILVCYLILILGMAAQYLLTVLLYKKEVDKYSVNIYLRQYMR